MLLDKHGKPILRARWGKPRDGSCLVRISTRTREILDRVPVAQRRAFVDRAVRVASCTLEYRDLVCGSLDGRAAMERTKPDGGVDGAKRNQSKKK